MLAMTMKLNQVRVRTRMAVFLSFGTRRLPIHGAVLRTYGIFCGLF